MKTLACYIGLAYILFVKKEKEKNKSKKIQIKTKFCS